MYASLDWSKEKMIAFRCSLPQATLWQGFCSHAPMLLLQLELQSHHYALLVSFIDHVTVLFQP